MCAAVCLYAHLTLDDVIVLVDLQDISRVAGDGAAVSIVEVVARATALLCIADPGFLAVNGLTRIMYTTTRHCVWGQGWEGVKEEEQTTEMTKLKKIKNKTNLKIPLIPYTFFVNIIALQTQKRGSSAPKETNYTSNPPHHPSMTT